MEVLEDALLQIHLLGGFVATVAGRAVTDDAWRLRRARTLIKLLVLAPERRMHREQLEELLWPEGEPAANALHQVMYTARRALGGAQTRLALRDGIVALASDGLWVDVDEFEARAAEARAARTIGAYREALALYGGELLPEDRFEDWAQARRDQLRETQLALLVELAACRRSAASGSTRSRRSSGRSSRTRCTRRRTASLMRLFAEDGRGQQALAQYQQLRDVLRRELSADPDPQTRDLYREILAGQHESAAPSSLPRQLTGFVGRERELAELGRLLGDARLLTLTGPGGCGKTRLSLELARGASAEFADGVHGSSSWRRSATRRWSPARRRRAIGSSCARRTRSAGAACAGRRRAACCSCSTTAST